MSYCYQSFCLTNEAIFLVLTQLTPPFNGQVLRRVGIHKTKFSSGRMPDIYKYIGACSQTDANMRYVSIFHVNVDGILVSSATFWLLV